MKTAKEMAKQLQRSSNVTTEEELKYWAREIIAEVVCYDWTETTVAEMDNQVEEIMNKL
jgi:hypothetical protein